MDPKKYGRFLLGKAAFSLLARQIRSALADLVLSYGKKAVVALQVKGVGGLKRPLGYWARCISMRKSFI